MTNTENIIKKRIYEHYGSLSEVAKLLNVDKSQVTRWVKKPTMQFFTKISALGIPTSDLNYMLKGEVDSSPPASKDKIYGLEDLISMEDDSLRDKVLIKSLLELNKMKDEKILLLENKLKSMQEG